MNSHNKFYYMKKEAIRVGQHPNSSVTKRKKKREFIVEPHRLEIDDYMLGQIKKSKHSIKKLKQQIANKYRDVNDLKKEVEKLHDSRDDYMMLSKTQDRSASSRTQTHPTGLQRKVFVSASPQKIIYKKSSSIKSKDSLVLSRNQSISSRTSLSSAAKAKKQSKLSKQRLKKKIQQLKLKARIESTQKRIIKLQVEKKIEKIVSQQPKTIQKSEKIASSPQQAITQPQQPIIQMSQQPIIQMSQQSITQLPQQSLSQLPQQPIIQMSQQSITQLPQQSLSQLPQPNEQGYQELLQLLKTNKSLQSASLNLSPSSLVVNQFQADKRQKEYNQPKTDKQQKIEGDKTLQSTINMPMKSSTAFTRYLDDRKTTHHQERMGSDTNLLESSPGIDTPQTSKRSLKLSRCFDVRIINENNNSSQEGSGFENLLGGNHFRSNTLQMSFEDRDNPKRRLRELEFEFDQLVRQQLISSDSRQKERLSLTIRTVLSSIAEVKEKIGRESK